MCKPWIRHLKWLSASKIPMFQFTMCTSWFMCSWVGSPFACYRGHLGFSGPKSKKSPKMSPRGLSAPGPKTSKTESKTSRNSQKIVEFDSFFDSILDPQGREAPGTHFWTFFRLWAGRAQMTPVAGKRVPAGLEWELSKSPVSPKLAN